MLELQVQDNNKQIDELDIVSCLLVETIYQMIQEDNRRLTKAMTLSAEYFSQRLLSLSCINRDILDMVELEIYKQI